MPITTWPLAKERKQFGTVVKLGQYSMVMLKVTFSESILASSLAFLIKLTIHRSASSGVISNFSANILQSDNIAFVSKDTNIKRMRESTKMAGEMSAKITGVNTGKEKHLL